MEFHDYFLCKMDSIFSTSHSISELNENFGFLHGYLQGLHDFKFISDIEYECLFGFLGESFDDNKKRFDAGEKNDF